ncbi:MULTISPECIES: amidohydrolase family protein [unclassified Streptomyces]|uniref:amidohydrolase family protein n=1 Tax=unclassified Streptomyces TaxID=2593676 RepID=UPI0022B7474E|nr:MULTISPECIES: amidohydrolase family protein [unclassified Streptomyces]MCZ7415712.1 amidohydrolase family protein [Streptomyces sp. WMMC897]MCZ7434477.1 amidohydrolase family protein [Streptomyces sp. WMMC1477]
MRAVTMLAAPARPPPVAPAVRRHGGTAGPDWRGSAERFGRQRAAEVFDRLRRMREREVRLIAGTDVEVGGAVFDGFVWSLEFFAHVGCTPTEIVDTATSESAEALGIGGDTGALRPGFRADLLVVGGDPAADLRALPDVRPVTAGGHPHAPADPDARH